MLLNTDQRKLLDAAATAVRTAWCDQWTMIEEEEDSIAAEYLITTSVALALSAAANGRVRIERLIGRSFCNAVMRQMCSTPVPPAWGQGRIDVVVCTDGSGLIPCCLVELKRGFTRPTIESDADRIACLIGHTGPKLPDIFGFCLFPMIHKSTETLLTDYEPSRKAKREQVLVVRDELAALHPNLTISVESFPEFSVTRPSVVAEVYDDGTEEQLWNCDEFQMEPTAIVIQKRDAEKSSIE